MILWVEIPLKLLGFSSEILFMYLMNNRINYIQLSLNIKTHISFLIHELLFMNYSNLFIHWIFSQYIFMKILFKILTDINRRDSPQYLNSIHREHPFSNQHIYFILDYPSFFIPLTLNIFPLLIRFINWYIWNN